MTDEELIERMKSALVSRCYEGDDYCRELARAALSAIRDAGYVVHRVLRTEDAADAAIARERMNAPRVRVKVEDL